jgi:hemoglobin/transferrin/lactoferrin receptor protein
VVSRYSFSNNLPMKLFIPIALALWAWAGLVYAMPKTDPAMTRSQQTEQLTITVLERAGGSPVADALIKVYKVREIRQTLVTNAKGQVSINLKGLDASQVTISVEHADFSPRTFNLDELLESKGQVELQPDGWLLDEVVVSANRTEEPRIRVPQQIAIISRVDIARSNPATSAEVLERAGVFVQRSQLGGGSPILRGFEASRVLIVVDGVRMNNAIYRAGHLQNVITLDPGMLERTEVNYGAGSVLYGTDALGGVMHFVTRSPKLSVEGGVLTKTNAFVRYGTVAEELTGHLDYEAGGSKWASLTSITYKEFGDLRIGHQRRSVYPDGFGQKGFTVERIGGVDVVQVRNDSNKIAPVGYKQLDVLQKLVYQPSNGLRITLNLQGSTSSNVPRYDRLSEINNGVPTTARWDYGPQHRVLLGVTADLLTASKWYDSARITGAYQFVQEERITRNFNNPSERTQQERVQFLTFNADYSKQLGSNTLRYGLEFTQNFVVSDAWRINVDTQARTERPDQTRYPAGGARTNSIGAYISNRTELKPGLWFSQGIRYAFTHLENRFREGDFAPLSGFQESVTQDFGALVGNLGLVYVPTQNWRLATNLSTGFRAPNVDDIGKFFDSPPNLGQGIIIPNTSLKPERTWNAEATLQYTIPSKLLVTLNGFHTWLDDFIATAPTTYQGNDSVTYGGSKFRTYSFQNLNRAVIYGGSAEIKYLPTSQLEIRGQLVYTKGRVIESTSGKSPLAHIPPAYGLLALRYSPGKWWFEVLGTVHAYKPLREYQLGTEDNEQYATPTGMPNWYTVDVRAERKVTERIIAQLGLLNVFDQHYRMFSSNISGPGRNLVATLRYTY